jgi:hypothetical protein
MQPIEGSFQGHTGVEKGAEERAVIIPSTQSIEWVNNIQFRARVNFLILPHPRAGLGVGKWVLVPPSWKYRAMKSVHPATQHIPQPVFQVSDSITQGTFPLSLLSTKDQLAHAGEALAVDETRLASHSLSQYWRREGNN